MKRKRKLRIKYVYAPKTPEEIQEANKKVEEAFDFLFNKIVEQMKASITDKKHVK